MPRPTVNLLIHLHLIASSFFMPAAILYIVTGALYTIDIKGTYVTVEHSLPLETPLRPDLDACRAISEAFLSGEGIAAPSGGDRIRRFGTSFAYEWHGSNRDVLLSPTEDPETARIEVKNTTFYRRMVQLHKAKGGGLFKAYAVAFSAAILVVLLTGSLVAWLRPPLRIEALVSTGLGLLALALFIFLS
jgi:hypothetical protein